MELELGNASLAAIVSERADCGLFLCQNSARGSRCLTQLHVKNLDDSIDLAKKQGLLVR